MRKISGAEAVKKHQALFWDVYAGPSRADEWLMGPAQIETESGTVTTRIVEVEDVINEVTPLCTSEWIPCGKGNGAYMKIAAPLTDWTLIRDG